MDSAALKTYHDDITDERAAALPDAAAVADYRAYARGEQRYALSATEQRILANVLGHRLVDNLCKTILQALVNPLKIARIDVDGEGPVADAKRFYLERVALLNALPTLTRLTHWAQARDGDAALGIAWHAPSASVLFLREAWWNGTAGLWVAYDDFDRPRYAVKEWQTEDGWRRTVYHADRIERYAREGTADEWSPITLSADNDQWPVPWIAADGTPLNPPFVHFANVQAPNDGRGDGTDSSPDSRYGLSELADIMGLQDAANETLRDTIAALRFAGFPMLELAGYPPMRDAAGAEVGVTVEPGAVFRSSDPSAAVRRIPPGSLEEIERGWMLILKAVSRATTVPLGKIIGGEWPSGTALIMSMNDYFEKLESVAATTAPAWGSLLHKATRLANTFARAGLDESLLVSVEYAPVIRYDALTQAQVASAVAPFVSQAEVLRMLDYNQAQIEGILAERDADTAARPETQRTLAEVERTRAIVAAEQRAAQPDMAALMDRITAAGTGGE